MKWCWWLFISNITDTTCLKEVVEVWAKLEVGKTLNVILGRLVLCKLWYNLICLDYSDGCVENRSEKVKHSPSSSTIHIFGHTIIKAGRIVQFMPSCSWPIVPLKEHYLFHHWFSILHLPRSFWFIFASKYVTSFRFQVVLKSSIGYDKLLLRNKGPRT